VILFGDEGRGVRESQPPPRVQAAVLPLAALGSPSTVNEYADYPGGDRFLPWQDHEWPEHCDVPAMYLGEVGQRELAALVRGGDIEEFIRDHDVHGGDPPITLDMVPPYAPTETEDWDSTVHHFRCTNCGWDLMLWDAN
jgi:uncharacterized protein CbrC (UPF0167 family)